jgi:cytochrome c oxidase subunit IV
MAVHVSPLRTYLAIFFTLMVLTAVTVWVAFFDLGPFSNIVAMGIAITKATLVILYFMHLKYSTKLTKLLVASGFFWLGLLFLFTLTDYFSRGWLGVPGK